MLSRRCWAGAAVGWLLLVPACGGGDDGSKSTDPDESQPSGSTTTSAPPASDEAAVRPLIEDLLAAWDKSMTSILADPQPVADDPDHELRAELAESFTEDSPYVEDLPLLLDGYISQDTGIRPGPTGLAQQTSLLHFTEAPDDDHLSFVFCSYEDGIEYSLSDRVERPPSVGITQGAGEATRVDGAWRIYRLRQLGLETKPAGTPDPCPALIQSEETDS